MLRYKLFLIADALTVNTNQHVTPPPSRLVKKLYAICAIP